MTVLLTTIGWILAIAVAIPLIIFTVEILTGLWPSGKGRNRAGHGSIAILIPAHDEALGIEATLYALHAMLPDNARILVVADNCSDNTAELARPFAEVIERHSATERGKGYALAFGRDHLTIDPAPDAVLVLDADCRFAPGSIEALAAACTARPDAPAQAINLIAPDLAAAPMVQISGFAMVVKNLFRSRGMQRLGGAALLTGTGMAFPWAIFRDAHLATGSIVEDLGLGIALTKAGHSPRLIADARVTSAPAPSNVALQQRTRWEHGFLDTVRKSALPLLGSALRSVSIAQLLLALHLIVPPLALLLMIAFAVLLLQGLLILSGGNPAPAFMLSAILFVALAATLAAWIAGGRQWLSGSALLRIPFYILWKLPIYLQFFKRRETAWQRTPREGE